MQAKLRQTPLQNARTSEGKSSPVEFQTFMIPIPNSIIYDSHLIIKLAMFGHQAEQQILEMHWMPECTTLMWTTCWVRDQRLPICHIFIR